ncbi:unnamed protein product, partial [Mesorhabditis spiculigera]
MESYEQRKTERHRKRVLDRLNSLEKFGLKRAKVLKYKRRRMKRHIKQQASYTLPHELDKSPFGVVATHITNTLRKLKGDNTEPRSWRSIVADVEIKGKEIKMRRKELELGEEDEETEMMKLAENKKKNMTLDEQLAQEPVKLMREGEC